MAHPLELQTLWVVSGLRCPQGSVALVLETAYGVGGVVVSEVLADGMIECFDHIGPGLVRNAFGLPTEL